MRLKTSCISITPRIVQKLNTSINNSDRSNSTWKNFLPRKKSRLKTFLNRTQLKTGFFRFSHSLPLIHFFRGASVARSGTCGCCRCVREPHRSFVFFCFICLIFHVTLATPFQKQGPKTQHNNGDSVARSSILPLCHPESSHSVEDQLISGHVAGR